MKTLTPTQKNTARITSGNARNMGNKQVFPSLWRRLRDVPAAISRGMRLIRAYNDLDRMNTRTLQGLGRDYAELDRVLRGHRPRSSR